MSNGRPLGDELFDQLLQRVLRNEHAPATKIDVMLAAVKLAINEGWITDKKSLEVANESSDNRIVEQAAEMEITVSQYHLMSLVVGLWQARWLELESRCTLCEKKRHQVLTFALPPPPEMVVHDHEELKVRERFVERYGPKVLADFWSCGNMSRVCWRCDELERRRFGPDRLDPFTRHYLEGKGVISVSPDELVLPLRAIDHGREFSCFYCGPGQHGVPYRRSVHTGSSSGASVYGIFGRPRMSFSGRDYYGYRTVCAQCAARIDQGKGASNVVWFVVVVLVLAVVAYLLSVAK